MADPADNPAPDPTPDQAQAIDPAPASPTPLFICPYCGGPTPEQPRCAQCSGLLDPLSRQATQNAMGPWFIRDEQQPHRPGCSYETVLAMIARGKVTLDSVLRGPTTAQFWYPARRIPGIANKLGICHACQSRVTNEASCSACHTTFEVEGDRQTLGLMPLRLIPGTGVAIDAVTTNAADQVGTVPARSVGERVGGPPVAGRVMSSFGVPSATETRLRAELASSRQRNGVLLGILIGAVIVGLLAAVAMTVRTSGSSGAGGLSTIPGNGEPSAKVSGASLSPKTGGVSIPETTTAPVPAPSAPEGQTSATSTSELGESPAARESPAGPATEKTADPTKPPRSGRESERDILRRTKLP